MGGGGSHISNITETKTVELFTLNNHTYKVVLSKGTYKNDSNFWVLHKSSVGTITILLIAIFKDDINQVSARFRRIMNIFRNNYESIFATNFPFYNIKVTEKNIRRLNRVDTAYVISYNTAFHSADITNKSSYKLNITNYVGNYTTSETDSNMFNVFIPDYNLNRNTNDIISKTSYIPDIDKVFHLLKRCRKDKEKRYTTLFDLHDMIHLIYHEMRLFYVNGQDRHTTNYTIKKLLKEFSKYETGTSIKEIDFNHPVITVCTTYKLKKENVIVAFSMTGIEVKNEEPDSDKTLKEVILSVSSVPLNKDIEPNHIHNNVFSHFI